MPTRRARNTGTLYRKGDRWEARVILGYHKDTGKPIQKWRSFKTKADGQTYLSRYGSATSARRTFEEFAGEWLSIKKRTVGVATYSSYKRTLERHLIPRLGKRELAEITPLDVERVLIPHSPSDIRKVLSARSYQKGQLITIGTPTFQKMRSVLHNVFVRAQRDGIVQANPVAPIQLKGPRVSTESPVKKGLSTAELKRLRAAIVGEPGEAFVMLGLGTGARPSELLALRWVDIDFGHGLVSITASLGQEVVKGPLVRKDVKTSGGARRVKVDPSFLAPLQGRVGAEDDYVFSIVKDGNGKTKPMDISYVRKHWMKPLAAKAKLTSFGPYHLRHSFATACVRNGVPMTTAAMMMGHSSTKMLREVYAAATDDMQKDAATRLAAMFD